MLTLVILYSLFLINTGFSNFSIIVFPFFKKSKYRLHLYVKSCFIFLHFSTDGKNQKLLPFSFYNRCLCYCHPLFRQNRLNTIFSKRSFFLFHNSCYFPFSPAPFLVHSSHSRTLYVSLFISVLSICTLKSHSIFNGFSSCPGFCFSFFISSFSISIINCQILF